MKERSFHAALLDTLLPGGPLPHGIVAPPASALALADAVPLDPALARMVAEEAGDAEAFLRAGDDERERVLAVVSTRMPEEFARLVAAALAAYYQHPRVIEAFGWPARPPQPGGHRLAHLDETWLEPVRQRGPFWRKVD
jgi:hypothetical protein